MLLVTRDPASPFPSSGQGRWEGVNKTGLAKPVGRGRSCRPGSPATEDWRAERGTVGPRCEGKTGDPLALITCGLERES